MLRYRIKSFHYTDVAVRALKGHKMILRAVKKADAEEVGRAIHYHLDHTLQDILKFALKETSWSRYIVIAAILIIFPEIALWLPRMMK